MQIKKLAAGPLLTIKPVGRLDAPAAAEFESEVENSLSGVTELVLDMEGLDYVSDDGLHAILSAHKTMAKQGKMVIRNVNEDVLDVLETTGFAGILTIEDGDMWPQDFYGITPV